MAKDLDNGHHELMKNMGQMGDATRQSDFLEDVGQVAGLEKPAAPGQELPVGQRIKLIREHKGLSHKDLAQRTGLDEDFLRQVEQEAASPPLGVLIKLGKGLDMKLGTLIASGEDKPYTVVRKGQGQDMSRYASQRGTRYGYSYQALAAQKKNRSMEPFLVTLERADEEVPLSSHDGEEFIYVLQGEMEAFVGQDQEVLSPGDCIYYDSSEPHLVQPHGQGPCLILAVLFGGDH